LQFGAQSQLFESQRDKVPTNGKLEGVPMSLEKQPGSARLFACVLLVLGLLVGYFGLSANGYLVPACVALVMATLLWFGKAGRLFKAVVLVNLISGTLLLLVLAFGDFLGDQKLNVSGVSLLVSLLTGGPAVALVAPGLLLGLRAGKALNLWFHPDPSAA
jgi:hypothetical protein